jgi:hypothetical protein
VRKREHRFETLVFFVAVFLESFTKEMSLSGFPNLSSWKMLNEERNGLSVEWLRRFLDRNQVPAFKVLGYE